MRLLLDHSDGHYTTRPVSPEEALALEGQGIDVAHVEDRVYEAYLRHCERDAVWETLWRSISNEQYVRRRERELLPLEEADREITRLKSELARAERMASFFEDEWLCATGHQPRSEHDRVDWCEYTCVFPQPGCDVAALPFEDWCVAASDLLKKFKPDGPRHQGCCCGHAHVRLDEDQVKRLRGAGFIVEHESEEVR